MSVFGGLRGTGDWGTDERPKNFREMILWLNPNGQAPVTALMSRVSKEVVNDPEFSWWSEPNDLVRLEVNDADNLSATDTLVNVDSVDPSSSSLETRYGTALNLSPGDLLMVEPTTDSATFNHEIIQVVNVISATQFTVTRGAAGTTAAVINNDQFLLKIGSAFAEGTGAPKSNSRNPVKYFNYAQIFKTTYELTKTADVTKARTGSALSNDKKRKSWDHARDLEAAIMFGQRSETTGANGKPLRTTGGLRTFIPAQIMAANWTIANSAAANNNLLDAISPVFNWDSGAGDTRIAFCGNGCLNRINAAIHKASGVGATTIQFDGGASTYGMNFRRLVLPQGELMLKTHPLMSRHPLYTNAMFILDFSAIKWRPLPGRDTSAMDDIQTKDEDLRRGQWLTEAGIEVQDGGLTMKYIGGFDAAIA